MLENKRKSTGNGSALSDHVGGAVPSQREETSVRKATDSLTSERLTWECGKISKPHVMYTSLSLRRENL